MAEQIDTFESSLNSGNADADALYLVWAGPNDFLDYLGGGIPADPALLIEQGINNIVDGVTRLAELGAENLVIPNMSSLGRLPFSAEFRDEATAITIAFNGGVSLALDNLDLLSEPVEAQITQVDLFSATEAIATNPEQFGLNNVSDSLLLSGLEPTTTGFFFWDIFHPTTEAHALLADTLDKTISGDIPQPTFNEIVGTTERDFLFGTQNPDNVDGLAGNDLIFGGDGGDRLEGWGRDDWLFGEEDNDIINGGDDDDYLWGEGGDDLLFGGSGADKLLGSQGKDILIGGGDRDYLWGGSGQDYLLGGDGNDYLWGDSGNDILNGGDADDTIQGNQGDDLIDGSAGNDTLFGGSGADIFKLTINFDTDRIVDFVSGSDRIMLSTDLTFADLSLNDNQISVTATNETLATLTGFDTTTLTESDFI